MSARTLSKDDAAGELQALVDQSLLLLEGPTLPGRVDLDGWDPVSQQKQNGNVAGVVVHYWPTGTKGSEANIAGGAAPDRLDPRNALALVNLCRWLHDTWGVSELYHAGISGDADGGRVDCHGQGRAVDLVGVRGVNPADGSELYFTVADDWGDVDVDGLTPDGDWPAGTGRNTSFRLDASPDTTAAGFFRALYDFIAREWQDRTSGPDESVDPTTIGGASGFIMHPDHPDSDPGGPHGREAHKGHIHMQIGVTGTE